jgi:hypothetical protein
MKLMAQFLPSHQFNYEYFSFYVQMS